MPISDYEIQREANVQRNKMLLQSLGLDKPFFEPKEKPRAPTAKKRKSESADNSTAIAVKAARTNTIESGGSGARRSLRNVGKIVDYKSEQIREQPLPASIQSGIRNIDNDGPLGRESGKRIHDPKAFGAIPGIEVGTWWETREGCSTDAIHAPWVAGISPSKNGAFSVALSGGYDDDVDLGYALQVSLSFCVLTTSFITTGSTYTGSGGRDLKGTKDAPKNLRTAPQSSDQTFDNNFNFALKRSSETKNVVRVIRGFKLKSRYAPSEGYRYDGLYIVERAWMEKGLNPKGYKVCKFAFKRLPGQPPLPVTASDTDENDANGNQSSSAESEQAPGDAE